MLVLFQDKLHWIVDQHRIVSPTESKAVNRKKRKTPDRWIYIIFDVSEDVENSEKIAVLDEHCQQVNIDRSFDWESFTEIIEKKFDHNRCDYDYEYEQEPFWKMIYGEKTYYIRSIDKVMKDGFLCQLKNDDIRHFKFEKVHSSGCGTGIVKGSNNAY